MNEKDQSQELFCKGFVNIEQVKEYLKNLVRQNKSKLDDTEKEKEDCQMLESSTSLLTLKDTAAVFIMQVCTQWKFSEDVQVLAIEIYYQFITTLLSSLFKVVFGKNLTLNNDISNSKMKCVKSKITSKSQKQSMTFQNSQWTKTIEHITDQMELRAITSIAIASKFLSHYSHVSVETAIKFLALNGRNYSPDVMIKSEIRILKTMDFNVCSLSIPISYIQALLDCLLEQEKIINGDEIFSLSTNLLLCFYSCSHNVYKRYLNKKEKRKNDFELNFKMVLLSKDMVLLSCAVVSSASYIWSRNTSDLIIKKLSDITKLSQESIAQLSFILLEEILH